ncbi:MAG: hypothetical protein HQK55_02960 [Deltaproteobacteria bacterium]|nr:hypothetical protein [Deltaproteobacteria bacterium]
MENTFRYKVQHIGDLFVDQMAKVLGWFKSSTCGVSLTYDIRTLEKKKEKSYTSIGRRTVELRQVAPSNELFSDSEMAELFSQLDKLDKELSSRKQSREKRLYPQSETAEQPV